MKVHARRIFFRVGNQILYRPMVWMLPIVADPNENNVAYSANVIRSADEVPLIRL
jgi:hypothetical protein